MRTKDGPLGRRLQVGDRVGLAYRYGEAPALVLGHARLEATDDDGMALARWTGGGVDAVLLDDRAHADGLLPAWFGLLEDADVEPRAVRVGWWFVVRCFWCHARLALRRWTRPLRPVKRGAR